MSRIARNGTAAYVGLPQREASKLQDLWERDEVGVELSVEVRAPVVVGVFPMRIARHAMEYSPNGNGHYRYGPARPQAAPLDPAADTVDDAEELEPSDDE
jgi:hypothetical protein